MGVAGSDRARVLYDRLNTPEDVAQLISEEVEELYMDFKRVSAPMSKDDRKNFSKAVSGFGNTSGGVIVWGIPCHGSRNDRPYDDPGQRVKDPMALRVELEGMASGATIPVHTGVESKAITSTDGNGWVVTLVPPSDSKPLRSLLAKKEKYYYLRAGSDFAQMDHDSLARLFGRSEPPKLTLEVKELRYQTHPREDGAWLSFRLYFELVNHGRGIARDYFINRLESWPDSVSEFRAYSHYWLELNDNRFFASQSPARLGPGQRVGFATARYVLRYGDTGFEASFDVGAEGFPNHQFSWRWPQTISPGDYREAFLDQMFGSIPKHKMEDGSDF